MVQLQANWLTAKGGNNKLVSPPEAETPEEYQEIHMRRRANQMIRDTKQTGSDADSV
ncbi:hypothetical protein LDENG_00026410 [Lucifuga dentata]|nr:hypothetical protein LDENG_00026410 [Lucifuga dentata]